jgi:hypothetical protein
LKKAYLKIPHLFAGDVSLWFLWAFYFYCVSDVTDSSAWIKGLIGGGP